MPKTIQNINRVSFLFFATLGLIHVLSMLMLANNYAPALAETLYKTLDLPFLLATLIYGGSALHIGLNKIGLRSKGLTFILVALLGIAFVLALYLNFFFQDLT